MEEKAKTFIKLELKQREISYIKLSQKMKAKGYDYNDNSLRSKINRGTFSFAFLLEVCESLEIDFVCLDKS
jgi:hypothetical protein